MNKKGQIGIVLSVIIALIAGLVLYGAIVQNVGSYTTTTTYNGTLQGSTTAPAAVGSYVDLAGQEYISGFQAWNATDGTDITGNFTIDEGISSTTSLKTVRITITSTQFASTPVNITYVLGTDGYIESSGARAVTGLIAIFAALALIVVALMPTLRGNLMGLLGR